MARKIQTTLVDDLTGEEIAEGGSTLTFALDGVSYEIDLSEKNADEFRRLLEPSRNAGRRQTGRSARTTRANSSGSAAPIDREQAKAARVWLRARGYELSDRGRIKNSLMQEYLENVGK
jgi:hypothetical protein